MNLLKICKCLENVIIEQLGEGQQGSKISLKIGRGNEIPSLKLILLSTLIYKDGTRENLGEIKGYIRDVNELANSLFLSEHGNQTVDIHLTKVQHGMVSIFKP